MNSLYQQFGTNVNYETEGVVLDFGVSKFKVRRAGGSNRRFASVFSRLTKPYARAIQAGTMDPDKSKHLLMKVYFEAVLIEWDNVRDRDGNVMQFCKDNFIKLMSDLPDFWEAFRTACEDMRNFQDAQVEEDGEALGKA